MMSRRAVALLLTLALGLLTSPLAADAQQARKTARIGALGGAAPTHLVDAIHEGLREQGYVEGQNISIEWRWAHGRADRLPALAEELVRLNVGVILAGSEAAAWAAKAASKTTPIVMVAADPVGTGLVRSLARPGGNITGLTTTPSLEIIGKQLELLKELVPGVTRVAMLWNPDIKAHSLWVREAGLAAGSLGLQLQVLQARGLQELDSAFAAMARERVGALMVPAAPLFFLHRARLADLAAKIRLPAMYGIKENVEAGGLAAYGPNLSDIYRRAGNFVGKILKGAKPADLPVEQPTKFELVINMKTARAIGLTIPQAVLFRADKVIE